MSVQPLPTPGSPDKWFFDRDDLEISSPCRQCKRNRFGWQGWLMCAHCDTGRVT